jgi:hypothetical protein
MSMSCGNSPDIMNRTIGQPVRNPMPQSRPSNPLVSTIAEMLKNAAADRKSPAMAKPCWGGVIP